MGYPDYDFFINSFKTYFRAILKKLQDKNLPGRLIVDIGSGPGVFLNEAKKLGFRVMGVDLSREASLTARSKYGIKVWLGEFEKLKISPDTIDIITCFQTLEHMKNPQKFLKTAYRMLKRGGILLITTPNNDSLWKKILGRHWFSYSHNEHLFFWGRKSLSLAFHKCGFTQQEFFSDDWRSYSFTEVLQLVRAYSGIDLTGGWLSPLTKLNGRFRIPFPIGSIGVLARKD